MSSLAAHVSHGQQRIASQFTLNVEMVLLHVRTLRHGGNGGQLAYAAAQREQFRPAIGQCAAKIGVARYEKLHRRDDARRIPFQRLSIGVVPVGVFEEDTVAPANRRFSVPLWIKSETDPGRRVE